MTRRTTRKRQAPATDEVGDYVLCGGTHASYPDNWYCGRVLWSGAGQLVITRESAAGHKWLDLIPEQIIAETDAAAMERIEKAVRLLCDGRVSPDTDFIGDWVALFGDNMVAGAR